MKTQHENGDEKSGTYRLGTHLTSHRQPSAPSAASSSPGLVEVPQAHRPRVCPKAPFFKIHTKATEAHPISLSHSQNLKKSAPIPTLLQKLLTLNNQEGEKNASTAVSHYKNNATPKTRNPQPQLCKMGQEIRAQMQNKPKLRRFETMLHKISANKRDFSGERRDLCSDNDQRGEQRRRDERGIAATGDGKGSESKETGPLKLYPRGFCTYSHT